jgi:hypothetical protein
MFSERKNDYFFDTYHGKYITGGICLFKQPAQYRGFVHLFVYQHRLHQPSPQAGFVIAVIFSFVYIILLFVGTAGSMAAGIVSVVSLIVYGITSSYSILMLFFTMRNVRK